MSRRLGTYYTTADVEIDFADVLDEMTDEELLGELKRRNGDDKDTKAMKDMEAALADLAEAYHKTHTTVTTREHCYDLCCRDAERVLAARRAARGEFK